MDRTPIITGPMPADLDGAIEWARSNGKPITQEVLEDVKAGKVAPEDVQAETYLREAEAGVL